MTEPNHIAKTLAVLAMEMGNYLGKISEQYEVRAHFLQPEAGVAAIVAMVVQAHARSLAELMSALPREEREAMIVMMHEQFVTDVLDFHVQDLNAGEVNSA